MNVANATGIISLRNHAVCLRHRSWAKFSVLSRKLMPTTKCRASSLHICLSSLFEITPTNLTLSSTTNTTNASRLKTRRPASESNEMRSALLSFRSLPKIAGGVSTRIKRVAFCLSSTTRFKMAGFRNILCWPGAFPDSSISNSCLSGAIISSRRSLN